MHIYIYVYILYTYVTSIHTNVPECIHMYDHRESIHSPTNDRGVDRRQYLMMMMMMMMLIDKL
jgi:hypothetical protein